MTHYRQIIVNVAIEDNTEDTLLEKLQEKVQNFITDSVENVKEISEVTVKLIEVIAWQSIL